MGRTNVYTAQKFFSIIIMVVNIFSVTSKLKELKNEDPQSSWTGDMFADFNNKYAVLIEKEFSLSDYFKKESLENLTNFLRKNNYCPGNIHSCSLKTSSSGQFQIFNNRYFCLCNHTYDSDIDTDESALSDLHRAVFNYPPSRLLDSFCVDTIELEDSYVVTGVRFKRYDNKIHLEVQKAKLSNGRIISDSIKWHNQGKCVNSTKIFTRNSNFIYDGFKIVLNDFILPDNYVVTGVKFGEQVIGRYLSDNHNLHRTKPPIIQKIECKGTNNILQNLEKIRPSTSLVGNNTILSRSCQEHFVFTTTSFDFDYQQHIVPYVDLREVITSPPEAIHGIGWYYRGAPGYGGFLGLKIFVNRYY
ncbi:GSCOCG00002491001-RA-CDS [Cotesia congregata]|uniref:Uncharacterized protein n=1 Tax=Cotesia congregata TaxID=51543 RepID=A0A8J2MGL4_COTCN|nr:GSCOCG00002491001-RA-CDS [Cotesia congregata]CAG5081245.1 Protein of unknown function [Cotesia congregata]